MPLSLKALSGDLAGIVGVIAVDDDGTVKLWKGPGAGSTSGLIVGSAVSTAGTPAAFNSSPSRKYFETNTNAGSGNAVASSGIVAITDVDVKVDRTSGFAMMAVLAGTGDTVSTSGIGTFIQASRSTADSEFTGLGRAPSGGSYNLGLYISDFARATGAEAWGASHGAGSIAAMYNHSTGGQCYYGADGGALSPSGSAGSSGWMSSGDAFVGGIGGSIDKSTLLTTGSSFAAGKFLCVIIWNSRPAESVFDNIHADWLGTLFEAGSPGVALAGGAVAGAAGSASLRTKKLKLLVNSAAIGATVDGVVFAPPVSGIVGAEIGEFTGATIAAGSGADAGKGVLLIPVTAFGGSSLAVFDQPRVYLKNSTHFTPIWPGQVIEE
jgi:hypothetical protein